MSGYQPVRLPTAEDAGLTIPAVASEETVSVSLNAADGEVRRTTVPRVFLIQRCGGQLLYNAAPEGGDYFLADLAAVPLLDFFRLDFSQEEGCKFPIGYHPRRRRVKDRNFA